MKMEMEDRLAGRGSEIEANVEAVGRMATAKRCRASCCARMATRSRAQARNSALPRRLLATVPALGRLNAAGKRVVVRAKSRAVAPDANARLASGMIMGFGRHR